jgi:RNA polymerase sigma factor for flagellar operon FliA
MAVKRVNPNPPKKAAKTLEKKPVPVHMSARLYKTEEDLEDNVDFKNKNSVVTAFTPLVQIIAANITSAGKLPPNIHFDDLMSYGTSGLIKAWENFDKTKNVKFRVYASYRIRGEMLDKIRKEWKYQNPGGYKSVSRVEAKVAQAAIDTKGTSTGDEEENIKNIAANSSVAYLLSFEDTQSTGDSVADSGLQLEESVTSQIDFAEEKKALWDAVKTLAEDEKKIIKMFYIDDRSQKEIADALGYSKSKISRIHSQVLSKLRLRIQRKLNYDYD